MLPSLSSSSLFDKRIKTMLVCDALTLIGMRGYAKTQDGTASASHKLSPFVPTMTYDEVMQLGKFEGTERLSKDESELLMDLDDEFSRRGNFELIYPLSKNAMYYERFFE